MENTARERGGERGAIVVEATLSLTTFIFAMFMLLSVTQIAYTQARISVALDCAAKEIAQYAHVYFLSGASEIFSGSGGNSSELFGEVGGFLEDLGGEMGSISSEVGSFVTTTGKATTSTSVTDLLKDALGEGTAFMLMKKNLADGASDADAFLHKHRVEHIDMLESRVLIKDTNHIRLSVTYDIKAVQLLKA